MPVASPAQELTNVPSIPFVPNTLMFDQNTQRNHHVQIPQLADPGDGLTTPAQSISQAGIIAGIWVTWTATFTVALGGGTATTKPGWPYGWLANLDFSANFQNNIVHATGVDLHVSRFVMNPSMNVTTGVDKYPGTVGGGDALTSAAHALSLTWYVPVAADLATLIGAIYAQSAQNLITLQMKRELIASMVTLAGGATGVLSNGNFAVAVDFFDIPRDPNGGAVVTPDLSRVHGLNYFDFPVTNTGQVKVPLVPVNGNLLRLFVRLTSPTADYSPRLSDASGFTELDLHYGANKNPQQWDVNSLVNRNAQNYGGRVPYNYVVLDFMRENPVRDALVMNGVTDLATLINIASGTVINANTVAHIVQETLYS